LHENEHVQAAISKELTATVVHVVPSTAAAKVQSRLLSSKILSTEIATVVEDLKNVIQPKVNSVAAGVADDEITAERPKKLRKVGAVEESALSGRSQSVEVRGGTANDEGFEDEESDDAGWESGTVDDDELEPQEGWESGTVDDDEQEPQDGWESGSIPGKDEDSSSKVPPATAPDKSTGLQSTFLPSLSVGFTRGESDDSDLSESEVKAADIDIKKNRRGQRARWA